MSDPDYGLGDPTYEETASQALEALRARLRDLRDQWEESANWEVDNGNIHEPQALARCADALTALLVDPLTREEKAE